MHALSLSIFFKLFFLLKITLVCLICEAGRYLNQDKVWIGMI